MCMKTRKFHVVRVDDLKPLVGQEIADALRAGELLYVTRPERKDVILVDMAVCGYPQDVNNPQGLCQVPRERPTLYAV